MSDWWAIQWHRCRIWLREKRKSPGLTVSVRYVDGKFLVTRSWLGKRPRGCEDFSKTAEEEMARRRRLKALKGE